MQETNFVRYLQTYRISKINGCQSPYIVPYTSGKKNPCILTTEYQRCRYVNHTAGMKSRQPYEPYAKTSNE